MASTYTPPKHLSGRMPAPPQLSSFWHHLSNSLPLPLHLGVSSALISYSVTKSIFQTLLHGPVKSSWNFSTALVHSLMHHTMKHTPPQGRHSMDIVRFATSFDLPAFLFDAQFTPEILRIHNALELGKRVKKALDVEPKHPSYLQDERYVKGEWVNLKYRKDKIVLYLHGGAHIFLSPGTHRQLTTSISNTMGCPVLVLDYGLCPEVMFPGAVEDALACYLALIGTHHDNISSGLESGTRCQPTEIVIMGDSSGACLTLQLLYCIKALGLQMPLGAVLISPFVDHGMSSQSWDTNHASDFMALDKHGVHWAIESYSNGIDRKHPAISPLFQDLTGYPPILIQAGDAEVVTDDALRLYDRLLECNVPTAMQLYQDMFHVFQTFNLKQSKDAIRRIDQFVSELADSDADSGVFSNVELFTKQFINA